MKDWELNMLKVRRYRKFRDIKTIYKKLSVNAYPYWSYESIDQKMKTFKYRIECPKVSWFVVFKNDEPLMVAPLYIHRRKKLVRVMGDVGYNICDFQYILTDPIEIKTAIKVLIVFLKEEIFKTSFKLKWWYISDTSLCFRGLLELQDEAVLKIEDSVSVKNTVIEIGGDYDSYFKSLSKSVRQNVRTAYNRAIKDGYEVQFHFYENYSENPSSHEILKVFKQYMKVYIDRQNSRYKNGVRKKIKGFLIKYFHYDFTSAFYSYSFLADVTIGGCIAAMVKCYKDNVHRQIIIPMLAIDEEYSRYSPGMILVNELAKHIAERTDIDYISLGKGDEKYKYDMGGINYSTYKWMIQIN